MSYYQFQIPNQSSSPYSSVPMLISGIQGHVLEVTVVGCNNLKVTEWREIQDPYVCIEYGNYKHRTRTQTDGGKNPTFQQKFVIPLTEGLMEMNVKVWNRNNLTFDDFVGEVKVQLQKVLYQGDDYGTWPIQTKTGEHGGAVRLIMHYSYEKPVPSAPPLPQELMHLLNAPRASDYPNHLSPYPSHSPTPSYPPSPAAYPSNPAPGGYPSTSYSAPPSAAYAPAPYPPSTTYPPPPSSTYPPSPQASSYPQGPYGMYPRPPY